MVYIEVCTIKNNYVQNYFTRHLKSLMLDIHCIFHYYNSTSKWLDIYWSLDIHTTLYQWSDQHLSGSALTSYSTHTIYLSQHILFDNFYSAYITCSSWTKFYLVYDLSVLSLIYQNQFEINNLPLWHEWQKNLVMHE